MLRTLIVNLSLFDYNERYGSIQKNCLIYFFRYNQNARHRPLYVNDVFERFQIDRKTYF